MSKPKRPRRPPACLIAPGRAPGPGRRTYGCPVTRSTEATTRTVGQPVRCCRFFQRNRTAPFAGAPILSPAAVRMHMLLHPGRQIERSSEAAAGGASTCALVRLTQLTSSGTDPAALSADRPAPRDLGNVTRPRASELHCEGSADQVIRDWMGHTHQVVSLRMCATPVHVFDRTVARGGSRRGHSRLQRQGRPPIDAPTSSDLSRARAARPRTHRPPGRPV